MTICNFLNEYGEPPHNCGFLRPWVQALMTRLQLNLDLIRTESGAGTPLAPQLEALWNGCDVPPGGFVIWHDTFAAVTHYYVCVYGSVVGCDWTEITLS